MKTAYLLVALWIGAPSPCAAKSQSDIPTVGYIGAALGIDIPPSILLRANDVTE